MYLARNRNRGSFPNEMPFFYDLKRNHNLFIENGETNLFRNTDHNKLGNYLIDAFAIRIVFIDNIPNATDLN